MGATMRPPAAAAKAAVVPKKGGGSSSRRTERTSGLARLGLIDDREDRAQVGH